MAFEKTTSKSKPYKVEALRYPSYSNACTRCAKNERDLWAIWWIKPQKPADPPKDRYCFKCFHDNVEQQVDMDHLF